MQVVSIVGFVVSLYLFTKNIFTFVFSLENYKIHRKRLSQLRFKEKKTSDEEIKDLIDKLTKPVIKSVFPHLKIKNLEEIERDLKMAKWDNLISPIQFIALNLISKAVGVFLFLVFFKVSVFMAILWGVIFFFIVGFLLNNSANNRREELMRSFPDFIRIAQGYLMAGIPLIKSIEESIKFVSEAWQPILQDFVIEAELNNIESALDGITEEVDVFEVREFISLIKLVLEQGGDAKEGFESQATKIQEMLYDIMIMKIERRKVFGMLVQGPLLLCNLLVFGLPTFHAMLNMGM